MKNLYWNSVSGDVVTIMKTTSIFERLRGLLGRKLDQFSALWIVPCNSIHTLGMSYPLDVVYLDRNNSVIKLVRSIPSCRFSMALKAYSVIEFNAGAIDQFGIKVHDEFMIRDELKLGTSEVIGNIK